MAWSDAARAAAAEARRRHLRGIGITGAKSQARVLSRVSKAFSGGAKRNMSALQKLKAFSPEALRRMARKSGT